MPEAAIVLGERRAEQHAIEPAAPGPIGHGGQLERCAVLGLECPADAGPGDPPLEPGEVVVVEARTAGGPARGLPGPGPPRRPSARRRDRAGCSRRRGPGSSAGPPGRRGGRASRVGGSPSSASAASCSTRPAPKVAEISGAKSSMLGHMTRMSRGSSVSSSASKPQDAVAEHLDLAGAAVAGVDLHAAVAWADRLRGLRRRIVAHLVLQPAEEGGRGQVHRVVLGGGGGPEQELQLPDIAPPRCEQRVARHGQRRVIAATAHLGRQLCQAAARERGRDAAAADGPHVRRRAR